MLGYLLTKQKRSFQIVEARDRVGGRIFRQAYLDGKFFIAGSETAQQHPGYMDGAIQSAQFVTRQISRT